MENKLKQKVEKKMIGKTRMLFTVKDGCRECDTVLVSGFLKKWLEIFATVAKRLESKLHSDKFLMWEIELDKQRDFFLACSVSLCEKARLNSPGVSGHIDGYRVEKNFSEEAYIEKNGLQVSMSAVRTSCQIEVEELIDWIVSDLS